MAEAHQENAKAVNRDARSQPPRVMRGAYARVGLKTARRSLNYH